MLDELAIYNLSVKYPNTIDLVREVERIAKEEAIDECIEIAKDFDFYTNDGTKNILLRKLEQLKEQNNDSRKKRIFK